MNFEHSLRAVDKEDALKAPALPSKVVAAALEHLNGSPKGESFLMDVVQMTGIDYCMTAEAKDINYNYLFIRYGYKWPYDAEEFTYDDVAVELPFEVTNMSTVKEALRHLVELSANRVTGFLVKQTKDSR